MFLNCLKGEEPASKCRELSHRRQNAVIVRGSAFGLDKEVKSVTNDDKEAVRRPRCVSSVYNIYDH